MNQNKNQNRHKNKDRNKIEPEINITITVNTKDKNTKWKSEWNEIKINRDKSRLYKNENKDEIKNKHQNDE